MTLARSRMMAAIRGKHAKSTEMRLRMALVRCGIHGWKTHPDDLPGTPDFFFTQTGLAVFVDGCFWHACPKCGHYPKRNRSFWETKLLRNKQRDQLTRRRLARMGITVLRIWEHDLKHSSALQDVVDRVTGARPPLCNSTKPRILTKGK